MKDKTFIVALYVCLVCSFFVSVAAVTLRDKQQENKLNERKVKILEAAGLYTPGADVEELFERIEVRVIELESGVTVSADDVSVDPVTYNPVLASKNRPDSRPLNRDDDIAVLRNLERYAVVYLEFDRESGELQTLILPVRGYGLWSTMHAYLALDGDLQTVRGLQFFAHAETPGLGGEITNPLWQAQWEGKLALDDASNVLLEVVKGQAVPETSEIDGLAGATLTSVGVTNMMRFWLGQNGYIPLLRRLATSTYSNQVS